MSSILQKGIVPDWQYDMYHPLLGKQHVNRPANIQNLVSGQCGFFWACWNVERGEGHRHITQRTTISQEM